MSLPGLLILLESWLEGAAREQAPELLCKSQHGTLAGMCRACRDSGPPLSGLVDIRTASRGQCIQLVKEEHAGCSCLGPVKELPHSTLALSDIPAGRQDRKVNRRPQLQQGAGLTCWTIEWHFQGLKGIHFTTWDLTYWAAQS